MLFQSSFHKFSPGLVLNTSLFQYKPESQTPNHLSSSLILKLSVEFVHISGQHYEATTKPLTNVFFLEFFLVEMPEDLAWDKEADLVEWALKMDISIPENENRLGSNKFMRT